MSSSADAGRDYRVLTDVIRFKVTGEETGGAYLVVEIDTPPHGGPPPMHTHHPHETFCVLEGQVAFFRQNGHGVTRIDGTSGDVVHIPSDAIHTFRNLSPEPARLWAVYSPAGPMEAFFREAGRPLEKNGGPDLGDAEVARVMAVGERHGMRWLHPPEL